MVKIDNRLFISEIIRPLEKNLHINIFLNDKNVRCNNNRNCPLVQRGEPCGTCASASKFDKTGRYLCIKVQEKGSEMLIALFHELGHATLHNIHNVYETNPIFCEAEAEEFARVMCNKLNIPYNGYFREDKSVNIVDYYWRLYGDYCSKQRHKKRFMRKDLINSVTNRIIGYDLDYKKFL